MKSDEIKFSGVSHCFVAANAQIENLPFALFSLFHSKPNRQINLHTAVVTRWWFVQTSQFQSYIYLYIIFLILIFGNLVALFGLFFSSFSHFFFKYSFTVTKCWYSHIFLHNQSMCMMFFWWMFNTAALLSKRHHKNGADRKKKPHHSMGRYWRDYEKWTCSFLHNLKS